MIDTISWDIARTFQEFAASLEVYMDTQEIEARIDSGVWTARDAWNEVGGETITDTAAQFYSDRSGDYIYDHMLAHRNHPFTRQWCNDHLFSELKKGDKVLDFGCGIGWHSLHLAWNGYNVMAYDVPGVHLDLMKFRYGQLVAAFGEPEGSLLVVNPDDYHVHPGPSGPEFDAVFSYAVLEHFEVGDLELKLDLMDRNLKPAGKQIHFIDPNADDTHPMHRAHATEDTAVFFKERGYKQKKAPGVPQPGVWIKPKK
jgi:2-polyprenyl-3-methyl-5-hydroxy-6-metoxy-1,4-benzoquinol methylase